MKYILSYLTLPISVYYNLFQSWIYSNVKNFSFSNETLNVIPYSNVKLKYVSNCIRKGRGKATETSEKSLNTFG